MAKAKTTVSYADHEFTIDDYPVKWMNLTLYEARCVCGWYLRGGTPAHAQELGEAHCAEPDVSYPSVIFAIKDAENK